VFLEKLLRNTNSTYNFNIVNQRIRGDEEIGGVGPKHACPSHSDNITTIQNALFHKVG